jgi:hypothetical protein
MWNLFAQSGLEAWYYFAQILAGYAQVIAGPLSILLLCLTVRAAYGIKRTEILAENHQRYNRLLEKRADLQRTVELPPATPPAKVIPPPELALYCQQFWNLQADQFDQWQDGFLAPCVYERWLRRRKVEWEHEEEIVKGFSCRDGWDAVRGLYQDGSNFQKFSDELFVRKLSEVLHTFAPKRNCWRRATDWIFW